MRRVPVQVISSSGRDKIAEPTDPYEAVIRIIDTPGHDGMEEMSRVLIEEFALLGWNRARIARMFRLPRYVAAHSVYRARGPEFVATLLDEVLGPEEG